MKRRKFDYAKILKGSDRINWMGHKFSQFLNLFFKREFRFNFQNKKCQKVEAAQSRCTFAFSSDGLWILIGTAYFQSLPILAWLPQGAFLIMSRDVIYELDISRITKFTLKIAARFLGTFLRKLNQLQLAKPCVFLKTKTMFGDQ